VENREGDLCGTWRSGLCRHNGITTDADDLLLFAASERSHDRYPALEVELGESSELVLGEHLFGSEEAEVGRPRAQMPEVGIEPLLVVRTNRTDVNRSTVTKELFRGIALWLDDHGFEPAAISSRAARRFPGPRRRRC